jgi:hypothetical protein
MILALMGKRVNILFRKMNGMNQRASETATEWAKKKKE